MTRIAFYAPMKAPTHPVPSGDRSFARALMAAIATDGVRVDLVSDLGLRDGAGDAGRQRDLRTRAKAETTRLIAELSRDRPMLWVSYHNYYKAPDLIGPPVCAALDLPYVQIESTRSRRRLAGPWANFAAAAEAAADAADLVFYLTAHDRVALERDRPAHQRLVNLRPFLPRDGLPPAADCARAGRAMLSAGMMRTGDKMRSYNLIARTLADLKTPDWRLDIAGDGPMRDAVKDLMSPFGPRIRLLGRLDPDAMARAYQGAALFFWPGVNEGFGMVYLEAQAAGLPVVAQDRPGVRDVLAAGAYPAPGDGPAALGQRIDTLLSAPARRQALGRSARRHIAEKHLLDTARKTFWEAVQPLVGAAR